jgi:hypothetical protein
MRALLMAALSCVVAVALAGCHDYDHFRDMPDGGASADFALPSGDMAGCPPRSALPPAQSGCTIYTFEAGVPVALSAIASKADATVDAACGMLHVRLGAGASHDLWIDDLGAVRVEEKAPRTGAFTLSARVHGTLDQNQKFSGVYAADNFAQRYISVQTTADATGLHDHDVVFDFGATSAEQAQYPNATPAAGDSYGFSLERMSGSSTFTLRGSTTQMLTVSAPSALTPGVVVGNCCGTSAPAFDAYIEWMMVCQ